MQKSLILVCTDLHAEVHRVRGSFGCLQQELLLGQVANDPQGAFQVLPCSRSHLVSPRHSLSPQQPSY